MESGIDLPSDLVEVSDVYTESQVPSFFLAKRTGALPGDWDDWLNPLPACHRGIREGDQALCQRQ